MDRTSTPGRERRRTVLPSVVAVAAILALPLAASAQGGRNANPDPDHRYDPTTVETVSGVVDEVILQASHRGWTGMHLIVATDPYPSFELRLGPTFFLFEEGIELAAGDAVTATGSVVTIEGTKSMIVREISAGDLSLTLRDESGRPVWAGPDKPAAAMRGAQDPESGAGAVGQRRGRGIGRGCRRGVASGGQGCCGRGGGGVAGSGNGRRLRDGSGPYCPRRSG